MSYDKLSRQLFCPIVGSRYICYNKVHDPNIQHDFWKKVIFGDVKVVEERGWDRRTHTHACTHWERVRDDNKSSRINNFVVIWNFPLSSPKKGPTKYELYLKYTSRVTAKIKPPTNTPKQTDKQADGLTKHSWMFKVLLYHTTYMTIIS